MDKWKKMMYSINNIYWKKEATYSNVSQEEFGKILNTLKETGNRKTEINNNRNNWKNLDFSTDIKGNYLYIYTRYNGNFYVFYTNRMDNTKNNISIEDTGTRAIQTLHSYFKEINNNISFKGAFGYVEDEIKKCVPKSFYYKNEMYFRKILKSVSAIDGCSQYPSNMCGKMPDSRTAIRYKGTVKPSEEYPFAFYVKSGHVAEYNRFDTHNWLKSFFAQYLFRIGKTDDCFSNIDPSDDETILMKPSLYTLDKCWEHFYSIRKTDEKAKAVMNKSIGMMHTNSYSQYKLSHLVAIAIGRANDSLLKKCEEIGNMNILHICVDGIIYLGDEKHGEDTKGLGIYNQEYIGAEGILVNMNAYIMKFEGQYKVKHGAYNKNKDGTDIIDENIKDFNEVYNWVRLDPIKGE